MTNEHAEAEALGIGKQAIEIAQSGSYSGIALVRYQLVGKQLIPVVLALTPRQQADIRNYLIS